jgi:DHA2 family multidrug resistance protein-like MFS transporter
VRTFGQCLGVALLGAVISVYTADAMVLGETQMNAAQDARAIRIALWAAVAATALATAVSLSRIRKGSDSVA